MNTILQICIGAVPLLIGAAVYMIAKRKLLLPSILLGLEVICCIATGIVYSGSSSTPIGDMEAVEVYEVYKAMQSGEINEASQLIGQVFAEAADNPQISLAQARIYASQGSWEQAVALYQKVQKMDKSLLETAEVNLVEDIVAGKVLTASQLSYQSSNIAYLTSQGLNPVDFGFMALTEAQIESNVERLDEFQHNVSKIVANEIFQLEKEYPVIKDIEKIDKVVDQIMSYDYNTYNGEPYDNGDGTYTSLDALNLETADMQKVTALNSRICKYRESYPELFTERKYMEAYIFSEVIAGNKLDDIWEKGSTAEGEIIATMYVSGIINEDNFSEEFTKEYKAVYKEVLDHCKEIATDINGIKDINEIYIDGKSVMDIVTELNEEDRFALHQMSNDMEDRIAENLVLSDDLSHYYMAMSTVASQMGNDESAKEYFNQSVANSSSSGDKELAQVLDTIQTAYEEGEDLDYIQVAEQVANTYKDSYFYEIVSEEVATTVEGVAGTAISETKALVSIGKIDVSKFDQISVSVQYSGDVAFEKKIIKLQDCDIDIENFTITKRQYSGSKVILLCDVSGSMSDDIETLKEAVKAYIHSMNDNEQVNIVLFSDKIDIESGFMKDRDALIAFAESEIYTRGGTLIGTSTSNCLDQFSDGDIANTIIVMTDGEDNRPWSDSDISTIIGGKAKENNAYIYTIGVGSSVTQTYLEKIAAAGGGEFMYCSDISLLEGTYQFIHGRIDNEYVITFEAEDLDSLYRTLKITVDDGNMSTPAMDSANYTLNGDATEEDENVVFSTELPKGITIKGLDVNHIEKSSEKQILKILGTGFADAGVTNVYLESTAGASNCKIKEVTDTSITFQVAPSVAEGTYSVFVTMDSKKYKADRLVIGTADTSEAVFGAYHFKADSIEFGTDQTTLTGNVVLNDYLYFDGTVILQGNIDKDSSVMLYTSNAGYVHHDVANYSGIEKILLPSRASTKVFDSINVEIYDDGENYNNYTDYKVKMSEASKFNTLELGIISMEDCVTYIYPDRVEVVSSLGILKDNPITDVLTNGVEFFQIDDDLPTFSCDAGSKAMIMKEGPFTYFEMDMEADMGDEMSISVADFITLDGSGKFHLMFDTYNGQFSMGLVLGTGDDDDDDEPQKLGSKSEVVQSGDAGITVSITGERHKDKYFSVSVALPLELTFNVYGIPITVTDLAASLENYNITQALKDIKTGAVLTSQLQRYLGNKDGADLKVSGAVELVSTKALPSEAQKFVKKYLGDDVSLISAEDIYGSVGINYPHLAAGATVNVLGCVKVAQIDMELGVISYPDYIAELINNKDSGKHYGFTFSSFQGINFDWDLVGADIGGRISGVVTVDDFLIGGYVSGTLSGKMDVKILGSSIKVDGKAEAEASAAIWAEEYKKNGETKTRWKGSVSVVATAEGTASITVLGLDILEKDYYNRTVIVDEDQVLSE